MSITEDRRTDPWDEAHPGEPRGAAERGERTDRPAGGTETFERTPPQDIAAEQSVLGGMLLSKDAVADVVEILKTHDFYKPAHSVIFDAVLDLYGRGEPADAVTVAAALTANGSIAKIGGAPYLHTLMAAVPTAANASYYARIVAERAVLRRVIEAGTRIVQLGYGASAQGGRDVDDVVDLAQQAIYDVTEKRVSEDFAVLAEMLQPTLDEIEAVGAQGGMMTGVPTGFSDLDRLLNGLHAGQLIIVAGRPGLGKALALDTPLPTPDGWTTMGEVRAGDRLLGADGRPTTVVNAFEVLHDRPCFEVEFSDGSVIVADAEHLWTTTTRAGRRGFGGNAPGQALIEALDGQVNGFTNAETKPAHPDVVTTAQIAATLRRPADGRLNHAVRLAEPLALADRDDLPIPPYTLGVWLGEGHTAAARFTTADPEIVTYVEDDGFTVLRCGPVEYTILPPAPPSLEAGDCGAIDDRPCGSRRCSSCHRRRGSFVGYLRAAGVLGHKHIPGMYLRASEAQRRALLAGLMDTGGTVARAGSLRYTSTSKELVEHVRELITSLGYRPTVTTRRVAGRTPETPTAYTINFSTADDVFRLERKRIAHKERCRTLNPVRTMWRYVTAVRPVASVPVRCIQVDNDDHLYLAGRAMIPTHNSTAAMDFSRAASVKHNMASAIFSLEMSKVEIVMRLLSAEARVPLHVLRSGQLSDDDWTKLARRMGEISEAPLFVDDTPNMNLMEIRAKARRLKQRHDLRLIVVDYLQLMTSPKRTESRQQEVADLSRGLKLLAKEVECPVVAVSQLNRGPEQRTDKRPQLSDLRESGCLTAETRVLRADTGAETTMGELYSTGARDVPVWALDERLKYVRRHLTHVFSTGEKPVFRLRLASGREVRATANHPFLKYDGWTALGDLVVGDRIAAPRHVCAPERVTAWDDQQVILLAHMIGNGSMAARRRRRSHERFVPEDVFGLPKRQIALFLRHLWATDGSVRVRPTGDEGPIGQVSYASASRRLVDDVARLLWRFGIQSRIRTVRKPGCRDGHHLYVDDIGDQEAFCRVIGVHGERGEAAELLRTRLRDVKANTNVDTIPAAVWERVRDVLDERSMTQRELAAATGTRSRGAAMSAHTPARDRIARVAAILEDNDLDMLAMNDVTWDEIVEISPDGVEAVFDATVAGAHNFIANGIAVHNSIEQDADVVILLHRDDYYDKESPRAGEADFIVAKHRNGPTDTVTVAAQLHLSRFVDMAI